MDNKLFFFLILVFLLSFILIKLFLKFNKIFVDSPSIRSSHKNPTPTSGGISFVITSTFFSALIGDFIPLISLPLSIIGMIDDKLKIKQKTRYFVQLLTSISILWFCDKLNFNDANNIFLTIFLIILGTAFINIINFMDGIDGLVSATLVFTFLFFSLLYSKIFLIFVFSLIPFLIYNWCPAKVFMGDVGSTFLGAVIFGSFLQGNSFINSFSILAVLSPLLLDGIICILRRFFYGENIFYPHKLHLYQRLNQAGLSHSRISIIYCINVIFMGIICFPKNIYLISLGILTEIIIGIYIDKKFAVSFKKSLKIGRSSL